VIAPVYRWGSAVFLGAWTEDEAAAFVARVEQIAIEECERSIMADLEPESAS
jgi:uncharacterized Zn finger protein